MGLNFKRGLFRLWIVGSVVWLAAVAVANLEGIFSYVGFHYGLFRQEASWQAAQGKKHQLATLSQLCKQAHDASCPLLRDEASYTQCLRSLAPLKNEYDCLIAVCDRAAYLESAKALFATAGLPTDRLTTQACDDFQLIDVPYLRWTAVATTALPIILPWLVWLIVAWITKGFRAARNPR